MNKYIQGQDIYNFIFSAERKAWKICIRVKFYLDISTFMFKSNGFIILNIIFSDHQNNDSLEFDKIVFF